MTLKLNSQTQKSLSMILLGMIIVLFNTFPQSASAQTQADKRDALIKYRQIFMEAKGKHNQAIRLLITKNIALPEHIITHAEALSKMADDMIKLFPKGSQGPKSRVLVDVWDKNGNLSKPFLEQTENMKKEAQKMAEVAKKGNPSEMKKQLRALASNGCRGCHTLFRGE